MERGNIKRNPSRITRDVTVQASIVNANTRRNVMTIMAFVTMTQTSAFCSSLQEARSAHAPYYGTAEALAGPVC
eukprot:14319737-Ditylum_brightwellii.AAC.1